ncbi:MAG: YndJ family transporter [Sandaracinaceae bacterium]|nr:YndJ family transporter [Sandaracinaceae bacterium]
MLQELDLLRALLCLSLLAAPLGTHRFSIAGASPHRRTAHAGALACAVAGVWTSAPALCVAWLVFCAASLALFLRASGAALRSPHILVGAVPLLFSNIAAVWLVGGANDLRILGYGAAFSYYAALHGNVLGWMLMGALATLAERDGRAGHIYVAAVLVCLVSFLLIAFGIDQLRALKPIGVAGLSIAIPAAQLAFLRSVRARNRPAFVLGSVSLVGLAVTMALAWANELSVPPPIDVAGVRGMVSVHGTLNLLVVAPSFALAVALDAPTPRRSGHGATS